jgi:CBS domain containing-hemolysin-like protein
MNRFIHGFLDLLSIWFLQKFGKKPMHLFGGIGTLIFVIGAVLAIWLIAAKLIAQAHGAPFRPVADQPLFFLALVAVILGAQLFLTGFLGEMIARNAAERNSYNIKRTIR